MEAFEFEDGSVHLQLYVPAPPEVPLESGGLGQVPSDPNAVEDERIRRAPISMADMVHLRMTLPFRSDEHGRYKPYDGDVVFLVSEEDAITEDVEHESDDSNPEAVGVEVRLDSLCRLDDHTTPLELMYNPNIGDYEDMDGGRFRWTTTFQPLTADSHFISYCPDAAGDILRSLIDFTATLGGYFSLRGVEYPSKATLEASLYHDYDPSVAVEQPRNDYDAAEGAGEMQMPEDVQELTQEPTLQEAAEVPTEYEDPEESPEAVVPVLLRFLRKQDTWTYQGREESV